MTRLLTTAALLFASFHAVAEVTLTPLNNNTPADADDVMGNFNALKDGINEIPSPPDEFCTLGQRATWTESGWECQEYVYGWYYTESLWPSSDRTTDIFEQRSRNAGEYGNNSQPFIPLSSTLFHSSDLIGGRFQVHLSGVGNFDGCSAHVFQNGIWMENLIFSIIGDSRFLDIGVDALTPRVPTKVSVYCPPIDEPASEF